MGKYTDEQQRLIDNLKIYINKYGIPKTSDFKNKNGLNSINYYKKTLNLKSLKDILELAGVAISEEKQTLYYSNRKNISDEELLNELRKYNNEVGLPTVRAFSAKNGLPSSYMYYKRFGSFENALKLVGINMPHNRKWLFNRESLTDEEIKKQIKNFTDKYIKKENKLPTYKVIENQKNIPSTTVIDKRFGSLSNLFSILGYDLKYSENVFKDKLMKDYLKLAERLNRTPTSRDLDEYSILNECCSASTYIHHFYSIYNVQLLSGCQPVNIGLNKNREDLINDLQDLYSKLGRLPSQRDIESNKNMASITRYTNEFGSFANALKEAGFKDVGNDRVIMSPNGIMCLSSYEYDFCCMLEDYGFIFRKDERYKKYIKNLKKGYQFDFTVFYQGEVFFIEIFGMMDRESYKNIANTKIDLCKNNNLKLIDLYPYDFKNKNRADLYNKLMSKILKYKEGEMNDKINCI